MNMRLSHLSEKYLDVYGPTVEPMAMPTICVPMSTQSMGVPLVMRVMMLVIMLTRTARAEVPAARYMGSWVMLVRKGTSRKPPPTPRKAATAEMATPPAMGSSGLKLNSTPQKVKSTLPMLMPRILTPVGAGPPPVFWALTASSKALAACFCFCLLAWPEGEVSQNR